MPRNPFILPETSCGKSYLEFAQYERIALTWDGLSVFPFSFLSTDFADLRRLRESLTTEYTEYTEKRGGLCGCFDMGGASASTLRGLPLRFDTDA
jgi:hypothetical protein